MAAHRLAEMQGRADVDQVMEETPATVFLDWLAYWSLGSGGGKRAVETDGPEMTPEESYHQMHRLMEHFGKQKEARA